jgi:hypothetical protein
MAQLARTHPQDAFLIRGCYALFGIEVAVATLLKTLFYQAPKGVEVRF